MRGLLARAALSALASTLFPAPALAAPVQPGDCGPRVAAAAPVAVVDDCADDHRWTEQPWHGPWRGPDRRRPREIERNALDLFAGGYGLRRTIGPGRPGWQITFTQRGADAQALELDLGLAYRIPEPFVFVRFYGGAGERYRTSSGVMRPYVLTGVEAWLFFYESGFTFETPSDRFIRQGIRLRF